MHFPRYIVASLIAGLGGFLFGFDTGTIGPITAMRHFSDRFENLSDTVHGLLVSSILLTGALSSFAAGHLADAVGRPLGMSIGAVVFGIGAALEAASMHLAMLFVGRAITGIGLGLFLSTTVVYIVEISPLKNRGVYVSAPQFFITMALVTGYFFCYGTVNIDSSLSWRLPFAFQSLFAFIWAVIVILFLPQSPRWLLVQGRVKEATKLWAKLGVPNDEGQAETLDLAQIPTMEGVSREDTRLSVEASIIEPKAGRETLFLAFSKEAWRPTALGIFMLSMMQLSGIDGVLYYAPLLFQQAGLASESSSFLASGLTGVVIFVTTAPSIMIADRWSRRTSVIYGGLVMAVPMLVIGALYAADIVHGDHGAGRWVVIACIYIFTFVYSATWAITISFYASEVQPLKTRAIASSLGRSGNWIMNWLVAFTTPILLAHSSSSVYFIFGGATVLTAVVCFFWMPETRNLSLESIDGLFKKDETDSERRRSSAPSNGGEM